MTRPIPFREPPASPASPTAARILLVEDDVDMSRLLGQVLIDSGFAPRYAYSTVEMEALLQHEDVDLVLLDVMLPGENGISACRRLRAASEIGRAHV